MKYIQLTQGKVAVVDDADYEALSQWNWSYHSGGYAKRGTSRKQGNKCILMHRAIMDAPEDVEVDHRDGNKLNNQRENLRLATSNQNKHNTAKRSTNTSGFKGVSLHVHGRWTAEIWKNGKKRYLGLFDSPEEAARAYDAAAKEDHGEFARINADEGAGAGVSDGGAGPRR